MQTLLMFGVGMIITTYAQIVSVSFLLLANLTKPSRYYNSPGIIKIVSMGVKEVFL
jgi:hypothetical protein